MPSTSQAQQGFMGAAYARAKSGHRRAGDPRMTVGQLRDFAATPRKGLPQRAPSKGHYGSSPVRRET